MTASFAGHEKTDHREVPGHHCTNLRWTLVCARIEAVPLGRIVVQQLPRTQALEQSRRVKSTLRLIPRGIGQAEDQRAVTQCVNDAR